MRVANQGFPGVHQPQATDCKAFTRPETRDTALAWREAQAGANSEVFTKSRCPRTKHEARITAFSPWVREGWRHKKPPSGPLPPPASRYFPVHHCSLLFTIVRHCSPLFTKNIVLRQCPRAARSLLSCALWRGMGGHGAAWAAYCPRASGLALSGVLGGLVASAVRRNSRRPPGSCGIARTPTCLRSRLRSRGLPPSAGGLRSAAGWDERRSLSPQAGPELLADSTHGAGRARQLGCGRRAGFFTMLTRRREPRRQEQPRKSRTLFQDSP